MKNNSDETVRPDEDLRDDGVDVLDYLLVLWRYRFLIIAITLLCGLAAFGLGMVTPPTYEASARLIVSPPKTGNANEPVPPVAVATFRTLVENQALCAKVVGEFGLDKPPHLVTPAGFIARMVKVDTVRDTNVIVVKVSLWDPDLAAKVANRLAEAAEQLAQQLNQDETVTARDIIKSQLDQTKTRLERAETQLESFRKEAQLELLRKDVDAMLGQRGTLLALLVDIEAEKARLSQAEAQLAKRDRIDTLKRSIDTDPAAMEALRRGSSETGSVLPLQLRNESVDPVYEDLDKVAAESRTKLAGMEKQRAELIDVRRLDRDQQAKLSLLYLREMTLGRLQTEYDIAKEVYIDVSKRYEQTRLQVAGRSAQLQLMDTALPPDRPASPRVVRNTALAVVLGFMVAVIGAIFLNGISAAVARERCSRA